MSSRPQTPRAAVAGEHVPSLAPSHLNRGYGSTNASRADLHNDATEVSDFARGDADDSAPTAGYAANQAPPLSPSEDADQDRSTSNATTAVARDGTVSHHNTLKKKGSVRRNPSLKRSSSRKSLKGGSVKGATPVDRSGDREYNSAFFTPIPTTGTPTEILSNRFQAWRNYLKNLITYFREIQTSYDTRSKAILKVSNVIQNTGTPTMFITHGGLGDANRILTDYHKHALSEANKSRDIEADVISALSGLRSDLGAKIKEIKGLNGDFKNNVEKEKDTTRRAVGALDEAIRHFESHSQGDAAKSDPFIVRLGVDRQVERQIDEENYLHRAYLNLESSGRELESIVVGEIQKAFNALAGILRRESDDAHQAFEQLRAGPIIISKDMEWNEFVAHDPHFVNPELPLRRVQDIDYPGKFNPAAAEIRAGMLERKSKYLKSYTPGWYVLSPTHLHEFKSADNIYSQPPVMSLYLAEQKLGSHSNADGGSHKFMLKGRQSGGMHRGHSWVFRAESYDTMMAWFEAIKSLNETTGEERNAYVRKHARSVSAQSRPLSISSDGMEEDEADNVPYAASVAAQPVEEPVEQTRLQRPQPGGRFPSDLNVPRTGAFSDNSSEPEPEPEMVAAAVAVPGSQMRDNGGIRQADSLDERYGTNPYALEGVATHQGQGEGRDLYTEPTSVAAESAPILAESSYDTRSPVSPIYSRSQSEVQPVPTQTFVLPIQNEAPTQQVQPSREQVQPQAQQAQPAKRDIGIVESKPIQRQEPIATNSRDFTQASRPEVSPVDMWPQSQPGPVQPSQVQPQQQPSHFPNLHQGGQQGNDAADWFVPAALGAGAGALGAHAYDKSQQSRDETPVENKQNDRAISPLAEAQSPLSPTDRSRQPEVPAQPDFVFPASQSNLTDRGVESHSSQNDRTPQPEVPAQPVFVFPASHGNVTNRGVESPLSRSERTPQPEIPAQTDYIFPASQGNVAERDVTSPLSQSDRTPRPETSQQTDYIFPAGQGSSIDRQVESPLSQSARTPQPEFPTQPEYISPASQGNFADRGMETPSTLPVLDYLAAMRGGAPSTRPTQREPVNNRAAPTSSNINTGPINTRGTTTASSSTVNTEPTEQVLGGLEAQGAHPTGSMFPRIIRHNTDMSISQLHVPGEFPKTSSSSGQASPALASPGLASTSRGSAGAFQDNTTALSSAIDSTPLDGGSIATGAGQAGGFGSTSEFRHVRDAELKSPAESGCVGSNGSTL